MTPCFRVKSARHLSFLSTMPLFFRALLSTNCNNKNDLICLILESLSPSTLNLLAADGYQQIRELGKRQLAQDDDEQVVHPVRLDD